MERIALPLVVGCAPREAPCRLWANAGVGKSSAGIEPKRQLVCTLVACWEPGHQERWLVLTDLLPEQAQAVWYGLRAWIEAGSKDIMRGGWQWHQTKMADPKRAERLWLALAVATNRARQCGRRS